MEFKRNNNNILLKAHQKRREDRMNVDWIDIDFLNIETARKFAICEKSCNLEVEKGSIWVFWFWLKNALHLLLQNNSTATTTSRTVCRRRNLCRLHLYVIQWRNFINFPTYKRLEIPLDRDIVRWQALSRWQALAVWCVYVCVWTCFFSPTVINWL